MIKSCVICGQEFETKVNHAKFCSKSCKHKSMYQKSKFRVLRKDYQLQKVYGITLEQFNIMLERQKYKCAICKEMEICTQKNGNLYPLCVDHNHTTGQIRELLCRRCNMALGLLREDRLIIEEMKMYLDKHEQLKAVKDR